MINRNGSGKTHTHTQFGVVCVRFVFSGVKAPSGTHFVFAHCIYITHTYTYTLRKRAWHSGGVCACINVCVRLLCCLIRFR